jgi:hypothetical protein
VDLRLTDEDVRLPKEALLHIFGVSPWVWQQWACIRLENVLRFQRGHRNDLEVFNIQGYADELWDLWLYHPKNKEFAALFSRVGEFGQEELIKHVMDPFKVMTDVISNSSGNWDMSDPALSVYTYLSVLGSGFIDALAILFIQVAMPSVLYVFYISNQNGGDGSLTLGTRAMLFLTLVYYLFKTTRDLHSNFRRVVCGSGSTYSRILRMREQIWEVGNDNLAQSIGYVFDLFMNTGYVCILYIYNMFVLFNSGDAFDILGSVIIFELLFNLDEAIAAAPWWDEGGRWMKAGIIEMILQATIRRECAHSWNEYVAQFSTFLTHTERQKVEERFESVGFVANTFLVGSESNETINLLTIGERIEWNRWQEALSKGVVKSPQLEKQDVYFGGMLSYGISAVFQKHEHYRPWSQWEQIIFFFPVPTLVPDGYVAGSKLHLNAEISSRRVATAIQVNSALSKQDQFWVRVTDVLTLRDTTRELAKARSFENRCVVHYSPRGILAQKTMLWCPWQHTHKLLQFLLR